jgi:hypothetical protein
VRRPSVLLIVIGIVAVIALVIGLSGCTSGNSDPAPIPLPSATESPSVKPTAAPEPTVTEQPNTPDPTNQPEPTGEPTTVAPTVEAGTPATQFAERWGKRYPEVPEFAILKAANATCAAIDQAGANWNDNILVVAGIEAAVTAAGLSGNDALEFGQDAKQNYCSSVSNPT